MIPSGTIAIIGGGPAGLMAAETIASAVQGRSMQVHVFDAMPSVGRKFLLAGIGGLNLTHAEEHSIFVKRYAERSDHMAKLLELFDAHALREWVHGLGIDTFIGSSQRVFPTDMKAAPLLRAWLHRLRGLGVRFHARHRWTGFTQAGALHFMHPQGETVVPNDACVFALGGASWQRLGSNGAWVEPLKQWGLDLAPLQPSNCGFDREGGWSAFLRDRFAGQPVKPVALSFTSPSGAQFNQQGEFVLTERGVEGSLIYAASSLLRESINTTGQACFTLDLHPGKSESSLVSQLQAGRGSRSLATHLKTRLGLSPLKIGLLHELLSRAQLDDPAQLAAAIKALPITVHTARPIDEAISTAGGVRFEALDAHLMARHQPGVFFAGEMLDWEAPTGGYLLNACLASGRVAGLGVLRWIESDSNQ